MTIGLVGNQNSGKSTIYNLLTNSSQIVGNWAGVTIDKTEKNINGINIVDLPGIYSLNKFTDEEKVTIDYLNNVDYIVNVIDIHTLKRSLYLTLQLIELKIPMLILITKNDLLKNEIDLSILSNKLKINIITKKEIGHIFKLDLYKISNMHFKTINKELEIIKKYEFINNLNIENNNKENIFDKILLNRFLAIPIFFFIMFIVYYLSFSSINLLIDDYIEKIMLNISDIIIKCFSNNIIVKVINDCIINSIQTILSFLPSITLLFFFITLLEQSGYMGRIAFIFDKLFRKLGMNGKSIISFIIGTSCSVPAILSTKTIRNKNQRYLTAMLTSLIPCSAKMTIIMLFIKMIYKDNIGIHIFFVYLLSILIIIFFSIIFNKFIIKTNNDYFVSEIVDYQIPKLREVIKIVFYKVKDFIKRISKTMIVSSIVICFLYSFNFNFQTCNINDSILGTIASKFSFIFYPMLGKNSYECTIAIIQGLVAKEQVTSSLLISSKIKGIAIDNLFINNYARYAFMVFNLFCFPCINSLITIKKEIGFISSLLNALIQTVIAYLLAISIYQIGIIF